MQGEIPEFTMGDLLQELAEKFGAPAQAERSYDGLYTSGELAETLGLSQATVLKVIKEMYKGGKIEIGKKKIDRFGGGEATVQAYRLKGEDDG